MKALSLRQPWADMVCSGEKWLEFRSKPTKHRGKLLVCSSKVDEGVTVDVNGEARPLPLGQMLAVVNLVDCRPVTARDKKHPGCPKDIEGCWAWVFGEEIDILVPAPVRGRLGLFEVPDDQIASAPEGMFWYDYA